MPPQHRCPGFRLGLLRQGEQPAVLRSLRERLLLLWRRVLLLVALDAVVVPTPALHVAVALVLLLGRVRRLLGLLARHLHTSSPI